jgi:broad specificity phosphatase PhoE
MSATTRLWLAVEPATGGEHTPAAIYRAPGARADATALELDALRARSDGEADAEFAGRVDAELARIAAKHAGAEVAIVADAELIRIALAATLALPADRRTSLAPRASSYCVVDWPSAADLKPSLVAIDIDWSPPPPPPRRAKFPGGPGSAPSVRG